MNRFTKAAITLLGLLPLLLPATGQGFGFNFTPGNNRPQQQPGNWNFRPVPPSNARGTPPGSYQSSPGYGYPQQGRQASQAPRMELELSDSRPYVQENILLTLRIVSSGNIQTVDPLLPQNEGVMFNQIKGPTAYSRRSAQGRPEIVNELVYVVTPMRPGNVELPELSALVTPDNGYGTLTVKARRHLRMEVRPADLRVTPWLPLEQLTLTTNMDAPVEVEPGKPVTLVLTLHAAGATGGQLPSMEGLLQSPDFRVYRGKTETEGGLSKNGRHIMGERTEHYTLVPQYGGTLRLPAARVSWFNVNTGTVEYTSLPIKTLAAAGEGGGLERFFGGEDGSLFPSGTASMFWLPLLGIFLLLTGYWIGVWYKGRNDTGGGPSPFPFLAPVGNAVRGTFFGLGRGTGRMLGRMSPLPIWNRALARAAEFLPTSVRFWFWVRCVDPEQDPGVWCKTLQFMSCRKLSMSPFATLPEVAERIIDFQPKSDPHRVRELFRELDGAIYGNQAVDFIQWKREFKKEVRPGVSLKPNGNGNGNGKKRLFSKLPELNPKAA